MKGDFSRWDLMNEENLSGVLHQQGRLLIDRDWNDQTRLTMDWEDRAARHVIGRGVAAIPAQEPDAFKITRAWVEGSDVKLEVHPGRGWADGLAVTLPGVAPNVEAGVTRSASYWGPPIHNPAPALALVGPNVRDAVVLEVWREAFNAFQRPDLLIEPALGGPDTTERIRTAMRFRLFRLVPGDTCRSIVPCLQDDFDQKGKLKVTLRKTTSTDGDCPVVEGGGYVGFEHFLYRIEIAQVDGPDAMFKWSQFNGGLVGRGVCHLGGSDRKITIVANDQAIKMSGLSSFYLEVIEEDTDQGIWHVTYGADITLNGDDLVVAQEKYRAASPPTGGVFFRLWNGIGRIADYPKAAQPKELKDGIRLEFDASSGANYQPGDFWSFKVRAGEISNPDPLIDDQAPQGIHYHRVPLAVLNWYSDGRPISSDHEEIEDCRNVFRPLVNQTVCCTYTVGDGTDTFGDFNAIEDALRHLPPSGGVICLLPGEHEANVVIEEKANVRISGCDKNTLVKPRQSDESHRLAPIFTVKDSECITLEHMDLATLEGTAVVLQGNEPGSLREIEIRDNRILACQNAIHVTQGADISIHHNKIRMLDREEGDVAIFLSGEDALIERNDISVVPAGTVPPTENIPNDVETPDPADLCADPKLIYGNLLYFGLYLYQVWALDSVVLYPLKPFKALGGIQIAAGCERIKVVENRIAGGAGNGITLGSNLDLSDLSANAEAISPETAPEITWEVLDSIYDISVNGNDITNMGLSGIGIPEVNLEGIPDDELKRIMDAQPELVLWLALAKLFGVVGGLVVSLSVTGNHVVRCLQRSLDPGSEGLAPGRGVGGISLGLCEDLLIHENHIETNGTDHLNPVCGIFVLYADRVGISSNHILDNGLVRTAAGTELRQGLWGGVVLLFAAAFSIAGQTADRERAVVSSGHAARIHDNVVDQPVGRALTMGAFGPVSVVNNRFSSACSGPEQLDKLVGAVLIVNLGGLQCVAQAQIALAQTKAVETKHQLFARKVEPDLSGILQPHPLFPSGNTLFNDNQTRVGPDSRSSISQLILTLDDLGFGGNQSEMLVSFPASLREYRQVLGINTLLGGTTLRASHNRFKEMMEAQSGTRAMSLLTITLLTNNTTHNQGDHCIVAASVLESSLPALSLRVSTGNQALVPEGIQECMRSEESVASQPGLLVTWLTRLLLGR